MRKVYEPATVITDGLITILGIFIGLDLIRFPFLSFHYFWGLVYIGMAISAFCGALRHGWGPYWKESVSVLLNRITYAGIGMTTVMMLYGTAFWLFGSISLIIGSLIGFSFIVYLFFAFKGMRFKTVIYYYFPTLIIIFIMMLWEWNKGVAGTGLVACGLGVSFFAAGVQLLSWDPHKYFNHNDLYHVIQLAGMWIVYCGILQIK